MEFWGVEVKAGKNLKVSPGPNKLLHLSQASLGETKKGKGNESVPLFVKVDDQKLVIGTLSAEKCNYITYDLVFEKKFELSHNWANGSVYFCGYKTVHPEQSDDDASEIESGSEEDIPLVAEEIVVPEQKPSIDNAKPKVRVVEPIKEEKVKEEDTESDDDEDDSDDDSDDDAESEDESDDKEIADDEGDDSSDDEDEDDDSSDEEDEATPNKAEQNKKRPAPVESDTKTPTGKKAKLVTPQKIGGEGKKTGGHIATPYPSKQTGKTPANNNKSKQSSDGQVTCGSCSRPFKSNQALESHSKAKHSAAK